MTKGIFDNGILRPVEPLSDITNLAKPKVTVHLQDTTPSTKWDFVGIMRESHLEVISSLGRVKTDELY